MGRWAQAQRRGGYSPGSAPTPAPDESSFAISWDGSPGGHLFVEGAFGVPSEVTGYFLEVAPDADHTDILADGNELLGGYPSDTGVGINDDQTYVVRFAWQIAGATVSQPGPWLVIAV